MRKTLLTTTALAMAAGAAAAEVSISGSAEMGVAGSKEDSARFHTDINVVFAMSGETDGGVTFSTAVNLEKVDDTDGGATNDDDDHGGIAVAMSGPFGNVSLGDTDGAFDWALTETNVGGAIRDDHTGHAGYNGNGGLDGAHDGQILRYDNTIGPIGVAVSMEFDDEIGGNDMMNGNGSTVFGVGAKYSMAMPGGGSVGIGVGYQGGEDEVEDANMNMVVRDQSIIGASANIDLGTGIQAIINYSNKDDSATGDDMSTRHFGVGFGYTMDLVTLGANWGSSKTETNGTSSEDMSGLGISATYGLGGGATLQLGMGSSTVDADGSGPMADTDNNSWSLGLAFSF